LINQKAIEAPGAKKQCWMFWQCIGSLLSGNSNSKKKIWIAGSNDQNSLLIYRYSKSVRKSNYGFLS